MQVGLQSQTNYEVSDVTFLPFIDLDPSNMSCIYSALKYAREECNKIKQVTCFVTFDQPLYAKATDIVASTCNDNLKNTVVLLGGFHTIMSFLGAIGHIMSGSGIEELWATIYAKNAVTHMINGHAYSRAIRAHNLTQVALSSLILEYDTSFTSDEKEKLLEIYNQFEKGELSELEVRESSLVEKLSNTFSQTLQSKDEISRTARLWVQYFKLVSIVHCYIKAERTGNFALHLQSLREMIPFFHASGKYN